MTVGALGTLIDVLLFSVLRVRLGIPALMANTVSYSTGTVNNFLLHRNWTFANLPRKSFGTQFLQFAAVSLSALAVNNLLLVLLEPSFDTLFATSSLSEMAAKACAMGAGMCLSYLLQHLWTFRAEPQPAPYAKSQYVARPQSKLFEDPGYSSSFRSSEL
jgi:putative flippase GtrA